MPTVRAFDERLNLVGVQTAGDGRDAKALVALIIYAADDLGPVADQDELLRPLVKLGPSRATARQNLAGLTRPSLLVRPCLAQFLGAGFVLVMRPAHDDHRPHDVHGVGPGVILMAIGQGDDLDARQRDRREQIDRDHFRLTRQAVEALDQEVGAGLDVAFLDAI